ncbi:MAG: low molecular weight protein-tyrosine-phosphatase [Flavobacteriales bacterium]|jgi:protein-tyrosine phosphatase
MKILLVCLGNICRSPMAEGILRHKIREAGLAVTTDSAGTSSHHRGESPDARAVRCLREKGIDISDLRARPFVREDYHRFDRIYAMDTTNLSDILNLAPDEDIARRAELFLHISHPGSHRSVPDPWYGDMRDFEAVYHMLDKACDVLMEDIRMAIK